MPTDQINNTASEGLPDDARDDRTAAAVLSDDRLDDAPGGDGLKGPAPGGTTNGGTPPSDAQVRGGAPANPVLDPHPSSQ